MHVFRSLALALLAALALAAQGAGAVAAERRIALVVGEAAYPAKPIATAANDAGLIAQTLQAAGFDVTGARDLEEAALRQAFRDFLDKAAQSGPETVAFVYVSGYGLQLEGENYLVPVDAQLSRDTDIPLRALRLSDYLKPLADSGVKLTIVALDAARANPFKLSGQPLAGGLALYEPGGRALLAFNAAPGTIAPDASGDYGPYAHALAEMMRDGGRPLMEVFENTRLRVSETTKGGQVPWNSQRVETDFLFFEREANAPLRKEDIARLNQPIGALGPEDGFSQALRRDTLQGYEDYVATYPSAPYAKRARAMAAARREAMTWRRSRTIDTPSAYWSYLRRYPRGPHAWDARRRLAELRYEMEPPPDFAMVDYGYPPPPPDEFIFVDQPVIYFADPLWALPPPPPPPIYFLPPPPPDFIVLPPPVVVVAPYVLPAPPYVPIPVWQRPPAYIAPPPQNVIYANVHNGVVLDPAENRVVVRNPAGAVISTEALTAVGAGAAAVGVGAALPHFIQKRNPIAPAGVTPPGGSPAPGMTAPAAVAVPPLGGSLAPAGVAGEGRPQPGASGRPAGPAGPAPLPGAAPAGPGSATTLPAGLPARDHALPKPSSAGGAPVEAGPRPNRRAIAPAAPGAPTRVRPDASVGEGAPAAPSSPFADRPPRSMRGDRPVGRAPGMERGVGANGIPGEGPGGGRRWPRPDAGPDFGGLPAGRAPDGMEGARLPRRMREPSPDGTGMPPSMRSGWGAEPGGRAPRGYPRPDLPPEMGSPIRGLPREEMRGLPREEAPPRPTAMPAPRYRGEPPGGMPPQMREIPQQMREMQPRMREMQPRMPDMPAPMRAVAPPAMRAPAMDRPPPGMGAPPSAPQSDRAPRYEQGPRPRGGGFGGGFPGMN